MKSAIAHIFCLLLFICGHLFGQTIDTLTTTNRSVSRNGALYLFKKIDYSANIAASYTKLSNWNIGVENTLIASAYQFSFDSISTQSELHLQYWGSLSFIKYADSVFIKDLDFWELTMQYAQLKRQRQNLYSLHVASQYVNSYENLYDEHSERFQKTLTGKFWNPLTINASYGTKFKFWKRCYVDIGYIAINYAVIPRLQGFNEEIESTQKHTIIRDDKYIDIKYGFTTVVFIRKKINDHISWENNTRLFCNEPNRDAIFFDLKNRININLVKYVRFILDNRILYNPHQSYNVQYRTVFSIGLYIEH